MDSMGTAGCCLPSSQPSCLPLRDRLSTSPALPHTCPPALGLLAWLQLPYWGGRTRDEKGGGRRAEEGESVILERAGCHGWAPALMPEHGGSATKAVHGACCHAFTPRSSTAM